MRFKTYLIKFVVFGQKFSKKKEKETFTYVCRLWDVTLNRQEGQVKNKVGKVESPTVLLVFNQLRLAYMVIFAEFVTIDVV